MSDEQPHQPGQQLRVHCAHCRGDGAIPVQRMAIICGVPRTVVTPQTCPWCDNGTRRGFQPPV